jgi:hypothetical protein
VEENDRQRQSIDAERLISRTAVVTPVLPCAKMQLFPKWHKSLILLGAGEGIRTLDPDLGKVVLYH